MASHLQEMRLNSLAMRPGCVLDRFMDKMIAAAMTGEPVDLSDPEMRIAMDFMAMLMATVRVK